MNKIHVTLLEVYERHVKAGTCKFKSWCDLVEWVAKNKVSAEYLNTLSELSESAIETKAPKPDKKPDAAAKTSQKSHETKKGD